ncbi:MAG: metal-dependent transcriptional regulator [Bacillota bacterium]|jgi:DtxR family Mn-dependent transcriptional regulator
MRIYEDKFYTVRGYALLSQENPLTPSLEDYLEMICRLTQSKSFVRLSDLARALNVQPPSANKMVQKLAELGYIDYEKYGLIKPTKSGQELGRYFIERHEIIERFFQLIGVTENLLEQTEKIEHSLNEQTLKKIKCLVEYLQVMQPELIEE